MAQYPLVSFVICTYNHEAVVLEALNAAVSQTYTNIEIVVSDDCSVDLTWLSVDSFRQDYKGKISITVHRNQRNLGVARNWDVACRLSSGQLLVHAAGDDISHPLRVEKIVESWLSTYPTPVLISSNGYKCDSQCNPIGRLVDSCIDQYMPAFHPKQKYQFDNLPIYVIGFSLAVDRRFYEVFQPIDSYMWSEDEIIRTRALLLGPMLFLSEPLVYYRDGGLSNRRDRSTYEYINKVRLQSISRLNYLLTFRNDAKLIGLLSDGLDASIVKRICHSLLVISLVYSPNAFAALFFLLAAVAGREQVKITKKELISFYLFRYLPSLHRRLMRVSFLLS